MPTNRRTWIIALCAVLTVGLVWSMAPAQQTGPKISAQPIAMSQEEQEWLEANRNLRLGLWLGAPPIVFRGEGGSMQGLVPSYINLINRKLGLEPTRVRGSSFALLWELAKASEVDMVAAVPGGHDRDKVMLLSEPYAFMPIVVVTRTDYPFISGLKDLSGVTVAVDRGQVAHMRIPSDYPAISVVPMDDAAQALRAVSNGGVAAYVAAEPTVTYLTREEGIPGLRVGAITEYSYQFSVGVRKDWPILLNLVNRALDSIDDEQRSAINDYWTVLRDSRWVGKPQVWRVVGGVLLIAILGLIAIMVWNRKLSMEVERRKQAEEKYRLAHEATQHIIESADIVIVGLDYAGIVRLINPAGEAITGYNRQELIGQNWFDLVVPRERFPYVWDEFQRLLRDGPRGLNEPFENPILTKSGEVRHILWRNSATGDEQADLAIISFGTDITSRLHAEEELRLTQFAMDNAAVGIFRILPGGEIVYSNRTASESMGYTRGELKRLNVFDLSPEMSREGWPEFWERLKYNQMMTFELPLKRKNGEVFPAEVTAYYLIFKGEERAVGFFQDIAERKRVESLREDVERMVRHDLRSPTLAVQTLFKMFDRADNLTDDQRELLHSVKEASRRMVYIIDMSRALFRMETGIYVVKHEPVDLLLLANAILDDLAALIRIKEIDVQVTLCGERPRPENVCIVQSEEILCHALLSNLIKNALEAAPERTPIRIEMCTTDVYTLSVHNEGVIPLSIRESFFDKYITEGKAQGTGLGTYTARLVTTTLGGTIDFTTSEHDGTTLTVTLPLRRNGVNGPGAE